MGSKKTLVEACALGGAIVVAVLMAHFWANTPEMIRGAVMSGGADPVHEFPLAEAQVTIAEDPAAGVVHSDTSGYFSIPIPLGHRVRHGLPLTLIFQHAGYEPLTLRGVAQDKLCIARMHPVPSEIPDRHAVGIANVVVKYSIRATNMVNVGSAVQPFTVVNTGDVPCEAGHVCSPDGRWNATVGSKTLDAGRGNEFRNARVSCIAGPCPFTRIKDTNLSSPGQTLKVSVLDWSDTVTFLLEAEVYRPQVSDIARESYPVIFDRNLTFTLPAVAEGVSIQAEMDKSPIVFPLGPALMLSWANCGVLVNKDQTRVYRCELKPGYRFL